MKNSQLNFNSILKEYSVKKLNKKIFKKNFHSLEIEYFFFKEKSKSYIQFIFDYSILLSPNVTFFGQKYWLKGQKSDIWT